MSLPPSTEDDHLLEKILKNPFFYIFDLKQKSFETPDSIVEDDISNIFYSEEKKIIQNFLRPLEILLRPHINVTQEILNRIYLINKDSTNKNIIDQYGSDLIEKLETIRRMYRIHIESANHQFLEKEANKLVRRFFGENYTDNHKNFIKLKRYFEKLKTFHEISSHQWKDIFKLLETFLYIRETKSHIESIQERLIPNLLTLIRHTETFLQLLQKYLKINQIQFDPSTKSYTIHLTYDETIGYTLEDFYESYLQPLKKNTLVEKQIIEKQPKVSTFHTHLKETKSIHLDFYKSEKIISTYEIGSKDWNHSKEYFLELNLEEYQTDIKKFYQSFLVIITREHFHDSLQAHSFKNKKQTKEEIETLFHQYTSFIQEVCSEIYNQIFYEDFKGILKPPIFFYNLGAKTIYSILVEELKDKNLGEILYTKNDLIFREYPYNIIKKIFIDWFNDLTIVLDKEEVDSYIIYSQQLEFVLGEYLNDYKKILEYHNQHVPNLNYLQFNQWFLKNYKKIISIRKFYIYKRFFPELLLQLNPKTNV